MNASDEYYSADKTFVVLPQLNLLPQKILNLDFFQM